MPPDALHSIRDYLPLSDRLGTGGQPTAEQFDALRDAGYEVVINLALPTSTYALPDEHGVVDARGMRYVHIPVDFDAPSADDARAFFEAMDAATGRKVFVHCAMNMRASAFVYLYRTVREGVDGGAASRDLHHVWTPNPIWQQFLTTAARKLSRWSDLT
jgi:protein tyrosine phosphatase (PTP) superfamily phosphohydrolase (DUF442 family)